MTLGERIQELRRKKGYTQEKLALHLNLSRQAVAKWEQNACEPNLDCLVAMAELFEVDLDYLITGRQPNRLSDSEPRVRKKPTRAVFFSVLGAVAMLILWMGMLPTAVFSVGGFFAHRYMEAEKAGSQGIIYETNGDGTCSVWNIGVCTDTEVVIPRRSPRGDLVTGIDEEAFTRCSEVTSITIPKTVTSIDDYAFIGCSNLTGITVEEGNPVYHSAGNCLIHTQKKELIAGCKTSVIPSDGSVTSIGYGAFYGQRGLTEITIPAYVTDIHARAFYRCVSLTSVTVPTGVTRMEDQVFYECTSLTDVTIPEGVTSIGELAFYNCTSLASVVIPESVTSIGNKAFYYCKGLTDIHIPESVTSIGLGAFSGCESLTDITIPKGLKSIENAAFSDCKSLTEIIIPEGVTEIGSGAFEKCSNLNYVTIPVTVTHVGKGAFSLCSGIKAVYYSGTKAQWESMAVDEDNDWLIKYHYIHCADGDLYQ